MGEKRRQRTDASGSTQLLQPFLDVGHVGNVFGVGVGWLVGVGDGRGDSVSSSLGQSVSLGHFWAGAHTTPWLRHGEAIATGAKWRSETYSVNRG
jgi:hypothetical protein